ncbi:MAG TPA: DUF1080 domain-containing protein, partial [Pirellulales bacterium]|nr:DUF1080 domain-containing protein [Pirellulales bacterium]
TYKVEDGAIVGRTTDGSPNSFLSPPKDYGDFVLEFDVKCDPRLNSGCQIRSHIYDKNFETTTPEGKTRKFEVGHVYGYQCEVCDNVKGLCGDFWDEARRVKWLGNVKDTPEQRAAFKMGEWNHYKIVAQGDHIRSWVNGVLIADFHDSMDASGLIGFQVHGIKAGTGPYEVRWKNIKIRELSPGDQVD